jgi:aminobenzoyl-glutamate utilization protein B
MSVGVNYLREHIIDGARVHYAYADAGGVAPNVVQDHSLVKYEVRSPKVSQVKALFERVVKVARGAALMTETAMEYEVTMAFSDYQPNDALAAIADGCMREVGAPGWDEEDYRLAKKFLSSYNGTTREAIRESMAETYGPGRVSELWERPLDSEIQPYVPGRKDVSGGSTDVGDVTYTVPCLNLHVATACIGNVGHTWQMTAQARSSIGRKGLLTAVKALALTALRTMDEPEAVERAKALVLARNGGKYQCPLPDDLEPPVGRY